MAELARPTAPDTTTTVSRRKNALLSIVVPLFNEESVLPAFFEALEQTRLDCRIEYVCVNDGSRDATLHLLLDRVRAGMPLRVVNLSRNFGKEAATTAGLAHARGDAVVVMDADLQDPPWVIADFLEKWRAGYDVVYGIRSSRTSDTLLKRLTAKAFYRIFNGVATPAIPADTGDFRLMDRRVVQALLALPERNRFMKGLFAWVGFRQTGVPFAREPRASGTTAWSYVRLFDFAIDGLTSFSIAPLRLASVAGAAVSLTAFVYAAVLIARTLWFGVDVPGYASIMVVLLLLGGIQLFFIGIIGEYLGRLYMESKGRPLYIVSDVFGAETSAQNRPSGP